MKRALTIVIYAMLLPSALSAQADACQSSPDLSSYVHCKLHDPLLELVAMNSKIQDFANQSGPLSLVDNSTSLVDTTSASDIATASATLSPLSSKSRTPNSTDVSTSISMYALYALMRRVNPLDPQLFYRSRFVRSFSISMADSFPSDKGATADKGSRTYGAKYLIHAGRDLSSPGNADKRERILQSLETQIGTYARWFDAIATFMFGKLRDQFPQDNRDTFEMKLADSNVFPTMLADLNADDLRTIDSMIAQIVPSQISVDASSAKAAKEVLSAAQWSIGFSAKISKGDGTNTYRSEIVQDKPFAAWLKETMNVGWDFQNAQKATANNRQVARLALQTETPLNGYSGKAARIPLALIMGGEGDWGTNGSPIYKAQMKLRVTILPGVDLPLVGSYANRTTGVSRADLKGQLSIALDFAKIAKRFTKPAL